MRQAATSLARSKSYLGAQYRRLQARLGAPKAIKAMANKLARLVYRMLKNGQQYVDRGATFYEEKNRERRIKAITKQAKELGMQLIPVA